ncbi:NAD-dependent epimerase/dehydratase family protein [Sphingobacterium kyonggiense]|uniref:NAD-dependent epimerase/dehydratase family protein n=1 Tax=Sphingobacterium kyonggiense TaxID=714075 RepID=A0ABP7Z3S0_9SPHI
MVTILGSNGFIGSNLLKSIPNSKGLSLREKDWEGKLENSSVIINLIGKAHDHKGVFREEDYYDSNFEKVKEIYGAFVKSKATLLIHVSSIAAVEEIESINPLTEESKSSPISFYGKSKRMGEEWLLAQEKHLNKKVIIIRPPMVHGSGDKGNLGLLFKVVAKGIPYPFYSFNNFRSFISIQNFSFYLNEIISKEEIMEDGVYNISDNEAISTNGIIDIICEILNKKVLKLKISKNIILFLGKIGDFLHLPINSTRIKKMTSTLVVSNSKINSVLKIKQLPLSAKEGLYSTLLSFKQIGR